MRDNPDSGEGGDPVKPATDTGATSEPEFQDEALTRAWWNTLPAARARVRQVGSHMVRVHCHGEYSEARQNAFLVHGMADSSGTWTTILPTLVDHNVWLVDLPWSGRDGVGWPSVMSGEAWWDLALELAGVEPHLAIGHSYGATVLLDWLMRRTRTSLTQLILLSPFYQAGEPELTWDDLDQFVRDMPMRFKEALRVRFGGHLPAPAVIDSMARKLEKRVLPDGILEMFQLLLRSRSWPLTSATFRCDIVFGEHESAMVRNAAVALGFALPDSACHQIRHCGHYPMHEQPTVLNQLLGDLLAHKTMECKSA